MRALGIGLGLAAAPLLAAAAGPAWAGDISGAEDHPVVTRYPGHDLRWQRIETWRPFPLPFGPVTGYRAIDDVVEIEGRVTRSFYRYEGRERDFAEVFLDYRDALAAAGFEILGEGSSTTRAGTAVGGRQWWDVYLRTNPLDDPDEAGVLAMGTSSQGGAGAVVATRDRAAGRVYVAILVEQHAEDIVATLVDVIEIAAAETGLVAIDPEAIGRDMAEKGRVVLDGLFFDFDAATLTAESDAALANIAAWLGENPGRFFVVGHTDAKGGLDYNLRLSGERAAAVVEALGAHGVETGRLDPRGVGPLVPVFTNAEDAGRARNRRVELVERPD